jgi:hypothetical protein
MDTLDPLFWAQSLLRRRKLTECIVCFLQDDESELMKEAGRTGDWPMGRLYYLRSGGFKFFFFCPCSALAHRA